MMHMKKSCDPSMQDLWGRLYMAMAKSLVDHYGLEGRGVVREGVRRYAAALAKERKASLLSAGCKTNLKTFFEGGFGFPCGERCRKEWIRCSEQELFLNVAACPFADLWGGETREIGRIFCEEFYPVLVHEGTNEKAQINLGMCLLSGRDTICRFSLYLRPANVCAEKRGECFPAFDMDCDENAQLPACNVDYAAMQIQLLHAFESAAQDKLGERCAQTVRGAAAAFCDAAGVCADSEA